MIKQISVFYPLLGQVGITFAVWLWMYKTRLSEIKKMAVRPAEIATDQALTAKLKNVVAPSDNFKNLFEVPVLFYVLSLSLYVTHQVDTLFLVLMWLFVVTRAVHSLIHSTNNNVIPRFISYVTSSGILWLCWLLFAIALLSE